MDKPIIIVDTREQKPYFHTDAPRWGNAVIVKEKLDTGDYSLKGFEGQITVERKSVGDLDNSLKKEYPRFKRELIRMTEIPCRMVLVEGEQQDITGTPTMDGYNGRFSQLVTIFVEYGISFVWQRNRVQAEKYCFAYLTTFYRYIREGKIWGV